MLIKPKKNLEKLQAYAKEPQDKCILFKLDSNENMFAPSKRVLECLKNIDETTISRYPDYQESICEVAKFNCVEKNQVLLTNGADEAISVVFNTFLTENDSVLAVSPSFSMPKIYSQIIGAKYIEIKYETKWKFPEKTFLKKLKDDNTIKIIHLTSPNNPTGDIIEKSFIEKLILDNAEKLIVIDETYSSYSKIKYTDFVKKYENVVILHSCSKDFALAGLRIGYILSNKKNIEEFSKVISPYSVNSIANCVLKEALQDTEHLENCRKQVEEGKNTLIEHFKKLGCTPFDSKANFILVDCKQKSRFIFQKLKNKGVLVKKFAQSPLENHLRITIGTEKAVCKIVNEVDYKPTCVFDMDGVLIDVSDSYNQAIKETIFYFAKKIVSDEDISNAKKLGGLNNDWVLTFHFLKKFGIDVDFKDVIEKFQNFYFENGDGLINQEKLMIDFKVLSQLSSKFHIALFTGRPKQEAFFALKKFEIEKFFDTIVTMDDLPQNCQKPHPMGLEKIFAESLTNEMFYFGDTIDDINCALAFNLKKTKKIVHPIGIVPAYRNHSLECVLKNSGAEKVFFDINEAVNYLGSEKIYEKKY